jgi:NADH:ubiquinone oxidoreductase subunit C
MICLELFLVSSRFKTYLTDYGFIGFPLRKDFQHLDIKNVFMLQTETRSL